LDVFVDADAERCGELAVEVVLGEGRDAAERLDAEVVVEMGFDVVEHPLKPGVVGLWRGHVGLWFGRWRDTG
jgi:hypothetical protein